jgi:hypothetical protein
VCTISGQDTRLLAEPLAPVVHNLLWNQLGSSLVYVIAVAAVQVRARSHRNAHYCSLGLAVVATNGRMVALRRVHLGGRDDRTDRMNVVVLVHEGRKAGFVRSLLLHRTLGRDSVRDFVREKLSYSRPAARMVFHMAQG